MLQDISSFQVTGHSYTVTYNLHDPSSYTILHEDIPIATFEHLPYSPELQQEVKDLARKAITG
ncbi:hypothetical protein FXF51_01885 [Nonomuraea sp. PA05]|uniref:hypothetical protein n=1 Tax=Nonomuraea sp. PA05 TaxID=2604466 RepID=UPI0011D69B75|nr:hypothetical protein [Nonomuraea sp. PA05]TYB71211.1 hypothetical protein FXF51_01885 [Nonomuraea sp. PA05]